MKIPTFWDEKMAQLAMQAERPKFHPQDPYKKVKCGGALVVQSQGGDYQLNPGLVRTPAWCQASERSSLKGESFLRMTTEVGMCMCDCIQVHLHT